MHDWRSVPMPAGIAARPRDNRGYPITFVTMVGSDGRPDFTAINGQQILECIRRSLCGMCGLGWPSDQTGPEDHLLAFIGGPLAIENRNFLDPPMHIECAEYAMQVCPHIAIPTSRYSKFKGHEGYELFEAVDPDRPEKFGMLVTDGCEVVKYQGQPVFLTNEPLRVVWQADIQTHVQNRN